MATLQSSQAFLIILRGKNPADVLYLLLTIQCTAFTAGE